jgi:hypothetical protein
LYFEAYVMIGIFSRYIVGWKVAATESAELAEGFIADVFATHGVPQVVHADRGTSMASKKVADLLADLHVVRSHSRPHVSNDNPYSEAAFKTVKYHPTFRARFGSIQDARVFCETFFTWYNHDITTAVSDCVLRQPSTMDTLSPQLLPGHRFSAPHGQCTRNGSPAGPSPRPYGCPTRRGSIHLNPQPTRPSCWLRLLNTHWSHRP